MNGIWVRSEDGRRLVLATEFAVSTTLEPAKRARFILYSVTCGDELATYKTQEAAMKQIDDIQNMISLFGTAMQKHQHNPTPDEAVTYTTIKPKIYDLRERKVKEE